MIRRILHFDKRLVELDNKKNLYPYWKPKRFTRLIENHCEIYVCETNEVLITYAVIDPHGSIDRYCTIDIEMLAQLVKFLQHEKQRLSVSLEDSNNFLGAHKLFSKLGFIGELKNDEIFFLWKKKNAKIH